jgi:hypothetical protein
MVDGCGRLMTEPACRQAKMDGNLEGDAYAAIYRGFDYLSIGAIGHLKWAANTLSWGDASA